jgi:hypothetical protein
MFLGPIGFSGFAINARQKISHNRIGRAPPRVDDSMAHRQFNGATG